MRGHLHACLLLSATMYSRSGGTVCQRVTQCKKWRRHDTLRRVTYHLVIPIRKAKAYERYGSHHSRH
jgi:hypothetical protein